MRRIVPVSIGTTTVLTGALLVSALAFVWPLFASSDSTFGQAETAPLLFVLVLPLVAMIALAELSAGGMDAKTVALLGVLSALGAALRPLGAGTGGVELVFFLILLGGRVFGPGFGFVLGATTLLVSAFITAGVGPWLPYQILAAAWVGFGAGLLPKWRGRAELALLGAYGIVSSVLFGTLMNLSFWPFTLGGETSLSFVPGDAILDNLRRFVVFNVATSLGWDLGRAITTLVMVGLFGTLVLKTLRRANRRASFDAAIDFDRVKIDSGTAQPTET